MDAGGRLVTSQDGSDSRAPGANLLFNIRMSLAQDFLDRNRANWRAAVGAAADRGAYLACRPPFGYGWDEGHVLHVDEPAAELVREAFVRRGAERQSWGAIRRWFLAACEQAGLGHAPRSKNGVREMIVGERTRTYLGEHRVQSERPGDPDILTDHHPPIVTPDQWEAAQWSGGFHGRSGLSEKSALRGLVWCGTCGRRLRVGTGGANGKPRYVNYVCTSEGCASRASIKAEILDPYVAGLVQDAAAAGEPHVVAVIEGDTRYEDAMTAVERARRLYDEFRDDPAILEALGPADFAAGLRVKREALDLARAALSETPPPEARGDRAAAATPEVATVAAAARCVGRVVVQPARFRKGIPPAERVAVYLAGAYEPYGPDALASAA